MCPVEFMLPTEAARARCGTKRGVAAGQAGEPAPERAAVKDAPPANGPPPRRKRASFGQRLEVFVRTLSGETHVLAAYRHWTVGQVKKALQAVTSVPLREQRIVFGTTVLIDDAQHLSAFHRGGASEDAPGKPLELSLVRRSLSQAVWLYKVARLGFSIADVPEELRADRELVLTAVRQRQEAFQHADSALKSDRGFVCAAVKLNAGILPYVSPALREDREVVLAAVSRRGEALACAGEGPRADREVVLQAVSQHGLALRHAHHSLRADRNLAIVAAEQHPGAVAYASQDLRRDEEVLSAALRSKVFTLRDEFQVHLDRCVDEASAPDWFFY